MKDLVELSQVLKQQQALKHKIDSIVCEDTEGTDRAENQDNIRLVIPFGINVTFDLINSDLRRLHVGRRHANLVLDGCLCQLLLLTWMKLLLVRQGSGFLIMGTELEKLKNWLARDVIFDLKP